MKPTAFSYADYVKLAIEMERKNKYFNALIVENNRLMGQLDNATNELCQKCGRYREAHNGACNGCKWRKEDAANDK